MRGAWIEIGADRQKERGPTRRSPRGSVDRNFSLSLTVILKGRRSPRGGVDRNAWVDYKGANKVMLLPTRERG